MFKKMMRMISWKMVISELIIKPSNKKDKREDDDRGERDWKNKNKNVYGEEKSGKRKEVFLEEDDEEDDEGVSELPFCLMMRKERE